MSVDMKMVVFEALDIAIGFVNTELLDFTDLEIAEDLYLYDSRLEDADPKTLAPFVCEWRAANKNNQK